MLAKIKKNSLDIITFVNLQVFIASVLTWLSTASEYITLLWGIVTLMLIVLDIRCGYRLAIFFRLFIIPEKEVEKIFTISKNHRFK